MQYRFLKPTSLERRECRPGAIVDEAELAGFNVQFMLRNRQIEPVEAELLGEGEDLAERKFEVTGGDKGQGKPESFKPASKPKAGKSKASKAKAGKAKEPEPEPNPEPNIEPFEPAIETSSADNAENAEPWDNADAGEPNPE